MKWVHPLKGRRIKEVLAEVLAEKLGHDVFEDEFWLQFPALGPKGGARWGWDPSRLCKKPRKRVYSFDTMRDCLRNGFTLDPDGHLALEANANEERK